MWSLIIDAAVIGLGGGAASKTLFPWARRQLGLPPAGTKPGGVPPPMKVPTGRVPIPRAGRPTVGARLGQAAILASGGIGYTFYPGDWYPFQGPGTLAQIAAMAKVPTNVLMAWNPGVPPVLPPGVAIKIRIPTPVSRVD